MYQRSDETKYEGIMLRAALLVRGFQSEAHIVGAVATMFPA